MPDIGDMIAASSVKPDKKRLGWDNIAIKTNENQVLPDDSEENMKMIKILRTLE